MTRSGRITALPTAHPLVAFGTVLFTLAAALSILLVVSARPAQASPSGVYLAAGKHYTCAVTTSGGAKCWGDNTIGQLGDGTEFTVRTSPVDVSGLSSGVSDVNAGGVTTCAVAGSTRGEVCWGDGTWGKLGNGSENKALTPVDVSGLGSGVAAIANGTHQTCALTDAGGVKCWGYNGEGELGDGTTQNRNVPVDVVGLTSGVVALASGWAHTCAVTEAGGVKCWGYNNNGQLGDGTRSNRTVPVDVVGLTSGAARIALGFYHSCAVMTSGGAKCWGWNRHGQLGNGASSETPELTPVDVIGLGTPVDAIAAGSYHTCAITSAGGAKCWGLNGAGQLGDGTTTTQTTPTDVAGLTSGVLEIAGASYSEGDGHTCALTEANRVKCWGQNDRGQLGDGTTTGRLTPVEVPGLYGPPDTTPPTITGSAAPPPNANGWNNTPVTVSFTCSDSGSGVASCPSPTTVSGEGADQSVTGTAFDNAGNSASATVGPINIDLTGPSITGTTNPPPNGAGWNNTDVTVTWTCSDALSGIDGSCPADEVIGGEGSGLTASASVSDRAGNSASGSVSVNIDRTDPMTTATAPSGWNNVDVTVILNPFDNLSGVASTHFVLDGGPEQAGTTVTINTEGDHTLSYWSVDAAGNEEAPHTIHVLIDKTSPAITHDQSPPPNGNGWNRTDVTVTFVCTDELSGIASCTEPVTLTDEGLNQTVTGTATDNAGNSATDVVSVSIDRTDPSISGAPDSPPNEAGWYRSPVTVAFTCADSLSGIAGCPGPGTLSTDGADQSVSGTATDAADNSASATVSGINIDQTAPTVTIATPADGATYDEGQIVLADYSCADSLSGIDSCAGTVPSGVPIDTATPGSKTFSVTAMDRAGNATTRSADYTVNPVGADLGISISDDPDPVTVGDDITYTLTVTNLGPQAATGVSVTDNLQSGDVFASATASQGGCTQSAGTVACALGSLSNGASATVTIVTTPIASGTKTNSASVAGSTTDPNPANDSGSESTSATGPNCTQVGTQGNDTLNGTSAVNVICGLGGADTIIGRGRGDTLVGGSGNDFVSGGNGNDTLLGGTGNDELKGQGGIDQITGGAGDDSLLGGNGNDDLNSQDGIGGNDSIDGQGGNNDACTADPGDPVIHCP